MITSLINTYNKLARLLHLREILVFFSLGPDGRGSLYSSDLMTDKAVRDQVMKLIRQSTWDIYHAKDVVYTKAK